MSVSAGSRGSDRRCVRADRGAAAGSRRNASEGSQRAVAQRSFGLGTRFAIFSRWELLALLAGSVLFSVLRITAAWNVPPWAYPDSDTFRAPPGGLPYSVLSFAGHAPRMWLIPLVFRVLGSDASIVHFQLLASVAAWIGLAVVLAAAMRWPPGRLVAWTAVLLLGLTPEIARWDRVVLSESLSISLIVAALAAWIAFVTRPTRLAGLAAIALTGFFLFTRPFLFPVVLGIAALCGIWALRKTERLLKLGVVAALIGLAAWSTVTSVEVNDGYRLRGGYDMTYFGEAFTQNLYVRYLPDRDAAAWFRDHGMPTLVGMPTLPKNLPALYRYASTAKFYDQVRARPAWKRWVNGGAQSALIGYVATHPVRVVGDFLDDTPDMLRATSDFPAWLEVKPMPSEIRGAGVFFRGNSTDPWRSDVAACVALVLGLVAALRRRSPDWVIVVVGLSALTFGLGLVFQSWIGSAFELVRHAAPGVVLVRLGLVVVIVTLFDTVAHGARRSRGGEGRAPDDESQEMSARRETATARVVSR